MRCPHALRGLVPRFLQLEFCLFEEAVFDLPISMNPQTKRLKKQTNLMQYEHFGSCFQGTKANETHGGAIGAKLNTDWVEGKIEGSFVDCGGCGHGIMFILIFFFLPYLLGIHTDILDE